MNNRSPPSIHRQYRPKAKSTTTYSLQFDRTRVQGRGRILIPFGPTISFYYRIKSFKKGFCVSSASLSRLNPSYEGDQLLRLGGRLKNAALSFSEQYPIILPKHRVSELLTAHAHRNTLHRGIQLTLRTLRQRYWILGGRSLVKNCIRQCVTCTRQSANTPIQIMEDLSPPRVTPSSPFTHTGVDYAGPFAITARVGRGQKSTKHYVALFVCLCTRAIHLEDVDDYTTAGFCAAFQRFVSRRGFPYLYSDNGTNF